MKKIIFRLSCLGMMLLVINSCSDDFLNTTPQDRVVSEATWADAALSQAFVFNVYSFLGYGGFEEQALAVYTDEAMFTHAGRNIQTFTEGTETPSNVAWISPTYEWGNMYSAIREANVAIANLPTSTFPDDVLRNQLLGEAYFLRAQSRLLLHHGDQLADLEKNGIISLLGLRVDTQSNEGLRVFQRFQHNSFDLCAA